MNVGAPLQMWDKLRELATRERKAKEALEATAMDGEFREVGAIAHESPPVPGNPGAGHPSDRRRATPQPLKKTKREPGRMKRR